MRSRNISVCTPGLRGNNLCLFIKVFWIVSETYDILLLAYEL